MSSKRKRSDFDSDDEEPALGKQVLPVANLPADFDGTPQDGLQYLFTVRRDARLRPHVTRAINPYEIKDEPCEETMESSTLSATHPALPSEIWRETFLRRFKHFRANCNQPTIHIDIPEPARKVMPDRKNRDAWWAYLGGLPESEWNPPKKPKGQKYQRQPQAYGNGMRGFPDEYEVPQYEETQGAGPSREPSHVTDEREVELAITINPAESLPTPSGTPAPPERHLHSVQVSESSFSFGSGQPEPTPRLVRHLDHQYALHLLMYFAHWINLYLEEPTPKVCTISETHARWMFVLLSRVDDYITADEQSTLRSLARGCMSLVKERIQINSSPEEEGVAQSGPTTIGISSCWMVVTAVTGIWGQRDLWMDAETILSSAAR